MGIPSRWPETCLEISGVTVSAKEPLEMTEVPVVFERKKNYGGQEWLGGGNSNIFYFHPYLGKISNLTNIFQGGWNHQPDEEFARLPLL